MDELEVIQEIELRLINEHWWPIEPLHQWLDAMQAPAFWIEPDLRDPRAAENFEAAIRKQRAWSVLEPSPSWATDAALRIGRTFTDAQAASIEDWRRSVGRSFIDEVADMAPQMRAAAAERGGECEVLMSGVRLTPVASAALLLIATLLDEDSSEISGMSRLQLLHLQSRGRYIDASAEHIHAALKAKFWDSPDPDLQAWIMAFVGNRLRMKDSRPPAALSPRTDPAAGVATGGSESGDVTLSKPVEPPPGGAGGLDRFLDDGPSM